MVMRYFPCIFAVSPAGLLPTFQVLQIRLVGESLEPKEDDAAAVALSVTKARDLTDVTTTSFDPWVAPAGYRFSRRHAVQLCE